MGGNVDSHYPTLVRRRQDVAPIFHPTLRRTQEVIRRPDWVRRAGEAVAHRGSIGALALFGIMFSNCFGGGYGFEDTVGAAGPLVTLIVGLILPWIWSFPTGLAVAELSTSVPSNSGILMWVNAAFPAPMSFMCILITIFITFVGNATYPSLVSEYVGKLLTLNKGEEIGVKIAVVIFCCILNCSGIEIVGLSSIFVSIVVMMPFLILSFQQIFTNGLNGVAISYVNISTINWSSFVSMVSWNYANIENAGSMVEEVSNPRRTFPFMMLPLMLSSYVAYLLPMLAGVSALGPNQDWTKWEAGRWPEIAYIVSGSWLKYYLFGGAMISGIGFTLTSMCCTSRVLAGIGTMHIFPKKISRIFGYYHPTIGTPIPAILLNTIVTIIFCTSMEFNEIVALCQAMYSVRLIFMYSSLIKLRIDHPKLPRPYALPFKTKGVILCLLPSFLFCLASAVISALTSLAIGLSFLGFMIFGSLGSYLYCYYFAPDGFQGVIVQCEISDDDDDDNNNNINNNDTINPHIHNNSHINHDNYMETPQVNPGVFYDDGYREYPGEHFIGILPLSASAPNTINYEKQIKLNMLLNEEEEDNNNNINNNNNNSLGMAPFGQSAPTALINSLRPYPNPINNQENNNKKEKKREEEEVEETEMKGLHLIGKK